MRDVISHYLLIVMNHDQWFGYKDGIMVLTRPYANYRVHKKACALSSSFERSNRLLPAFF